MLFSLCSIEPLIVTSKHPFYVKDKGWVEAHHLRQGDLIQTDAGDYQCVKKLSRKKQADRPVYNMSIVQAHTYYVNNNHLLVHNTDCKLTEDRVDEMMQHATYVDSGEHASYYDVGDGTGLKIYTPEIDEYDPFAFMVADHLSYEYKLMQKLWRSGVTNIPQPLGLITHNGSQYLWMEHIQGVSPKEYAGLVAKRKSDITELLVRVYDEARLFQRIQSDRDSNEFLFHGDIGINWILRDDEIVFFDFDKSIFSEIEKGLLHEKNEIKSAERVLLNVFDSK